MINDNKLSVVIFGLAFVLWLGFSFAYSGLYDIPFGMSDIDRYLCYVGSYSLDTSCEFADFWFFKTHLLVPFILYGLSVNQVNLVISFWVWAILPLSFYIFARDLLDNPSGAVHCTLYFMFGTFVVFAFGWMMLLAQMMAFVFYLLSLSAFHNGRFKMFVFLAFLSVLAHPYIVFFYCLLALAWVWHSGKPLYVLAAPLVCLFSAVFLLVDSANLIELTIFSGVRAEPSLYDVFFLFTSPILTFLFFCGLLYKRDDVWFRFALILCFVCPFTHISRGMPYLHVFMAVFGFIGLRHLMKNTRRGRFVELVFLGSLVFWFYNLFLYFCRMLVFEMPLRGLNPEFFMSLIGI